MAENQIAYTENCIVKFEAILPSGDRIVCETLLAVENMEAFVGLESAMLARAYEHCREYVRKITIS